VTAGVRRLIVNADDFGLTAGVTRGILDAHRLGIVTSATVLVTEAVPGDAIRQAQDAGLALGLHVNLTLGVPLTRGRSLVDGAGRFVRDARRAAARAKPKDVEAEVDAQVDRFLSLVRRAPTHLDSHHHVALHAPVRAAVLAAAHRLGVPVRSEDARARASARAARLKTTDHFIGGSGPDPYWTVHRTVAHLRSLAPGVTEFMTHPGAFDDALAFSRYGRQRETELVGLGGREARGAAAALGIALCHFGDL
jgi:predicted glycoside hydrolase/deacetylase ChbG (UPF0249 family)